MILRFKQRETRTLSVELRKNINVIHYYNEIIRFWNKLNFIIKNTFKAYESLENEIQPQYFYATYRILWENASEIQILNELPNFEKKFIKKVRTFSWDKALAHKDEKEKLSISAAIPSFMIDRLIPLMSKDFIQSNVKFMNRLEERTEITLRINNLNGKINSQELLKQVVDTFKKNKIHYHKDHDIPELFWIPLSQKNKVIRNTVYQESNLIFQDKASAAVIHTLAPNHEEKICDMCAAPGIKTSLISQYMNNKGHIIAGEFLTERAKVMRSLFIQFNILNAYILNTDSIILPIRFQNYFDSVLLDAPCTGSGTFLANPELKWRQNEKFLHQNVFLQKKLFENALKILKLGGILVYSTCSLYPEEGEYQILDFMDRLEPLDIPKWFSPSYKIDNKTIQGTGRLFPSVHHTQGFFIGKFKKKE